MDVQNLTGTEWPQLAEFLNQQLRPNDDWSIFNEYPLTFTSKNIHNIRVIKHEQKIVAHAVMKVQLIKTPIGIFRVAAIGSVVTHPLYRSKGYSKQLIEDCLENAKKQDCDFAILWTDIYDFYRRMNFELAGSELSFVLDKPIEAEPKALRFYKSNRVDPNAVLKIFQKHSVTSLRTAEDITQFLKIPNSKLYTAWDHSNQLQAYAVEGRGADLKNYIHEWGGGVSKILPLLSQMQQQYSSPLTLIVPEHSQNLRQQLQAQNFELHHGFLGMMKIVNFQNLAAKILRYARQLGLNDFVLNHRGNDFLIGHQNKLYKTNSEKDIVRLLFGPYQASEIYPELDEKTRESLSKILPLKMWVWGWDSV